MATENHRRFGAGRGTGAGVRAGRGFKRHGVAGAGRAGRGVRRSGGRRRARDGLSRACRCGRRGHERGRPRSHSRGRRTTRRHLRSRRHRVVLRRRHRAGGEGGSTGSRADDYRRMPPRGRPPDLAGITGWRRPIAYNRPALPRHDTARPDSDRTGAAASGRRTGAGAVPGAGWSKRSTRPRRRVTRRW